MGMIERKPALMAATIVITVAASITHAEIVYISSTGNDEVLRYDADTGAFIDTFITAGSGGLDQPHGILERCDDILVCSFGTDNVLRFDRETGAFIDVFISAVTGLDNPVYIMYGPDDRIYISSQASDEILRFTTDGEFDAVFVAGVAAQLDGPSGFAFGADNRLYVAGRFSANVVAYDGATGAFLEVVADAADGLGAGDTFGLNFGDNGDLYFASAGSVFRFDTSLSSIVTTIPLGSVIGLEPGPAGGIYAATANNLRIISTTDNSVSDPVLTGGVINILNFFRFPAPTPAPGCPNNFVPAMSQWGLVIMTLFLLGVGSVAFRKSRVRFHHRFHTGR
ncbi:MAG: IPTL-CTERM sorting domain-containing protein [Planctomycetota bacterium]